MSALTITAKGEVTLRKELLLHLGAMPGDKITVENCRMAASRSAPREPRERSPMLSAS